MSYEVKDTRYGVNWIGAGESNLLKSTAVELAVPVTHRFHRLFCGWINIQAGDLSLNGRIRMYLRNKEISIIPFGWQTRYTAGVVVPQYFSLPFTVNRRPYGAGNDFPYDLPASPNCKIAVINYVEFSPSVAEYHAQITMQPIQMVENFDRIRWEFDFTSGTIAASAGAVLGLAAVESSQYPI